MAHIGEKVVFDSADAFALRVKYEKHVLFIPVDPSTSYDAITSTALKLLSKSDAAIPPESSGFHSFGTMGAEDVAIFLGGTTVGSGTASNTSLQYAQIDRSKKNTVAQMGLKDGQDAVAYLGFRSKGGKEYMQPNVRIPSLIEEEEEEDPDAIPPPLDEIVGDQDAMMGEVGKGKSRA